MPTYDYRCDDNGRTLEVRHGMTTSLKTWGELCEMLGMEPGPTPEATPVRKVFTSSYVVKSENLGSGEAPPCETGGPCCGGGFCDM